MNKVVLITGASSGIGKKTAIEFAKHNHNIIIHYLSHEKEALNLCEELKKAYKIDTLCIKADLTKEEDIITMTNQIEKKFQKLDIIVNNAGIALDTIFENKTKKDFLKTLETNLIAPFLISKHTKELMLKSKSGSIINVTSTNGIDSYYPYSMDYDASKAALNNLTKNLAVELSPYIRVNAVAPGWVNTPMNAELSDDFIKEELKKIALKRFAEPEEIAKIIYFLSTDDASYINGSIIIADGGRI